MIHAMLKLFDGFPIKHDLVNIRFFQENVNLRSKDIRLHSQTFPKMPSRNISMNKQKNTWILGKKVSGISLAMIIFRSCLHKQMEREACVVCESAH
jgi:hypothetical protein